MLSLFTTEQIDGTLVVGGGDEVAATLLQAESPNNAPIIIIPRISASNTFLGYIL
jgi:hypothetical protein